MGYRSDVVALFYTQKKVGENNWPALKLFIDENFPEDLKSSLEFKENPHGVGYVFAERDVKWYDSYSEVQEFQRFVSNFLELADGDDCPWCYEFMRVGEDDDDVEITYSDKSEGLLHLSRSIEIDF